MPSRPWIATLPRLSGATTFCFPRTWARARDQWCHLMVRCPTEASQDACLAPHRSRIYAPASPGCPEATSPGHHLHLLPPADPAQGRCAAVALLCPGDREAVHQNCHLTRIYHRARWLVALELPQAKSRAHALSPCPRRILPQAPCRRWCDAGPPWRPGHGKLVKAHRRHRCHPPPPLLPAQP